MSIPRRRIVQIINPVAGGAQYTTHKAALQLIRRGRAVRTADGLAIRLTDQVQASHCGGSGDEQGVFQWHRGISDGMAQFLGSQFTKHQSAARREDDRIDVGAVDRRQAQSGLEPS